MANNAKFGQSGWIARPTRRLYIVNGSKLVTAEKQQAFLPVANSIIAAKGIIASGEAVARVWEDNNEVFIKASDATATPTSIYFANADSIDWDVQACGKLPAIYAGDDFEIQTPFFDTDKIYKAGDPLYVAEVTIDNVKYSGVSNEGTGPVVGIVSKGVINLGTAGTGSIGLGFNSATKKNTVAYEYANAHTGVNADVEDGAIAGGPRVWTNDTGSQYVLQFYTKCIPAAS